MEELLKKICQWWTYLAGLLLMIIVGVTVLNTTAFGLDKIARMYEMNVSAIPGYEDMVRLMISCVALMFFPWTQLQRGHISVEFFAEKLSSKMLLILDKISLILTLALALFLTVYMFRGMLESKSDNVLSPILEWHEWPFFIPGVISMMLWVIVLVYQILFTKREDVYG